MTLESKNKNNFVFKLHVFTVKIITILYIIINKVFETKRFLINITIELYNRTPRRRFTV